MIIEVDKFKEYIKDYDPKRSEDFHRESGKLADAEFTKQLKNPVHKRIVLMAGGAASGKSEYAQTYLIHKDQLVYDGTLKNYHGFEVKNNRINRYSKANPKLKVVYILPKNWEDSFEVFLSRKRKMRVETFFETHIKSAQAISKILFDTNCNVEIYLSSFSRGNNKMIYKKMTSGKRTDTSILLKTIAESLNRIAEEYGLEIEV